MHGDDGVSVDDIEREVRGSMTSVYSFYGGRDGLFLAVMDAISQDMVLELGRPSLLTDRHLDGTAVPGESTAARAFSSGLLFGIRPI